MTISTTPDDPDATVDQGREGDRQGLAERSGAPEPTPSAQLENLTEPDDLSEAEEVAAEFTRALIAGDLDASTR